MKSKRCFLPRDWGFVSVRWGCRGGKALFSPGAQPGCSGEAPKQSHMSAGRGQPNRLWNLDLSPGAQPITFNTRARVNVQAFTRVQGQEKNAAWCPINMKLVSNSLFNAINMVLYLPVGAVTNSRKVLLAANGFNGWMWPKIFVTFSKISQVLTTWMQFTSWSDMLPGKINQFGPINSKKKKF